MGNQEEYNDMLCFVEDHKIFPILDSIYKLKDGNLSCEKMNIGSQFGKIVLRIS